MIELRLEQIDAATAPLVATFQLASTLELGHYLRTDHAERLEREIAVPLNEAISNAIASLARLESQLEGNDVESIGWNPVLEPTLNGSTPSISQMLSDELWQHVTDMCFTARGELRRELAAHDQRMLCEASRALTADPPAAAIAAALPPLHAMEGRDDELDKLVALALRDPPTREFVAALQAAVSPPRELATEDAWPGVEAGAPE